MSESTTAPGAEQVGWPGAEQVGCPGAGRWAGQNWFPARSGGGGLRALGDRAFKSPPPAQATHGLPADAWAHIASFLDHSDDFFCLLAALSDDAVTRACMHLPLPEWLPASKQDDGSEPTWAQWASLRHEELELDQLPEEHITLVSSRGHAAGGGQGCSGGNLTAHSLSLLPPGL